MPPLSYLSQQDFESASSPFSIHKKEEAVPQSFIDQSDATPFIKAFSNVRARLLVTAAFYTLISSQVGLEIKTFEEMNHPVSAATTDVEFDYRAGKQITLLHARERALRALKEAEERRLKAVEAEACFIASMIDNLEQREE